MFKGKVVHEAFMMNKLFWVYIRNLFYRKCVKSSSVSRKNRWVTCLLQCIHAAF